MPAPNVYYDVEQKLAKALCDAKYETNRELAEKCWCTVAARNQRDSRLKLLFFSLVGACSLLGLIPALEALSGDFSQSGFYEYFSLIFSDSGSLLSYWRELAFSLLESLPITSLILSFALIFIFFLSLKYSLKQIIRGGLSMSF